MRGTWSLISSNLRSFASGRPIPAAKLNDAISALERARPTMPGQGSGIEITQLPTGFAFRAKSVSPSLVMVVTVTIEAMTGTIPGQGKAVQALFNPATPSLTAGSGTAQTVWSFHEKTFIEGAIIAVFTYSGALWVDDVDKCANYV